MTRALFPVRIARRPTRPSRRLNLVSLEDRSVPANVTLNGFALAIDLDHSGESLTTFSTDNSTIRFVLSGGTFTGAAAGAVFDFGPLSPLVTNTITDSAGNTQTLAKNFTANVLGTPGQFLIEAEDFDFAGGQTKPEASTMPYTGPNWVLAGKKRRLEPMPDCIESNYFEKSFFRLTQMDLICPWRRDN